MATARYYFPTSGAAGASPVLSAYWTDPAAVVRWALVTTPVGSTMTDYAFGTAPGYLGGKYQWVSAALAAYSWTTSDTFKIQCRFKDDGSLNIVALAVSIRVLAGNGPTVRGTLYEGYSAYNGTDSSTATNTNFGGAISLQNNVAMSLNDRLVIEVGVREIDNGACTWRFGDAAASDLPEDRTTTTDLRPWIEFTTGGGAATNVVQMLI